MLAHQLHALGVLKSRNTPYDSDAVDILTHMYHDLGDTVALQYGGSNLINTIQTYRKTGNQYKSHARDTVETLKRYYANTFSDNEKQAAIDLFLGIVPPPSDQEAATILAEMKGNSLLDAVGHDQRPRPPHPKKRSYRKWFDAGHLATAPGPDDAKRLVDEVARKRGEDGYFNLYYRPSLWTALEQHFGSKMNSSAMFGPKGCARISFGRKPTDGREVGSCRSATESWRSCSRRSRGGRTRPTRPSTRTGPSLPARGHGPGLTNRQVGRRRPAGRGQRRAVVVQPVHRPPAQADPPNRERLLPVGAPEGLEERGRQERGRRGGRGRGGAGRGRSRRGRQEDAEPGPERLGAQRVRPVRTPTPVARHRLTSVHRYIHQFDALRLLETHASLAHVADLPIYERAIQLSPLRDAGGDDAGQTPAFTRMVAEGEAGVEPKDVKLYKESVKVASGLARSATTGRATRGPGRADGGPGGARGAVTAAEWAGSGPPKVRLAPPELDGIGMGLGLALGAPA